jgi:hypothetical protein
VEKLSEALISAKLEPVHALGIICPPKAVNKRKWYVAEEARLPKFYSVFDKAIGVLQSYKFVVAFENSSQYEGYVTEKVMNAALSGAVPIYWGHSLSGALFNESRVINVSAYTENEMDVAAIKCLDVMLEFLKKEKQPDFKQPFILEDKFEYYTAPQHTTMKSRLDEWMRNLPKPASGSNK